MFEVDERWVAAHYARIGKKNPLEAQKQPAKPPEKKRGKYGNIKTTADGIVFDSRREAAHYEQLKLMMLAGEINGFTRQQPFLLPGGVRYIADFVVLNRDGTYSVVDAKGVKTKEYQIKKRQMRACLGIEIIEV